MGLFGALLLASLNPTEPMPNFRGRNYAMGGYNPMYLPRHGKIKGYMKENRRCTFNKNR